MTAPTPEAVVAAKRWLPCQCDEIYKSRGLTAPDCPWHNYGEDVADQFDALARSAASEAARLCDGDRLEEGRKEIIAQAAAVALKAVSK